MRRFFAKNLLFVISVNLLVKPVWVFMIDRTVQNRVGHEQYGTYQALMNLGIIFQILLDFGITNYNSRTISRQPEKLRTLFPAMLSARVVLSFLYILLVFSIGYLLGYHGWKSLMLIGVLFIQALNSIMLFVRSNISGLHKFRADGLLSVTDRLLMIIVCSVLLFVPALGKAFKIEWFVTAQLICYSLAILIGLFTLRHITRLRLYFSLDYRSVFFIIKESLPYATLIFLMSVYTRADTMLIDRLCIHIDKDQAGIYAAAYRLLDVGNMFGLMFATMLLPLFGRMLIQRQDVQSIVRLSVNLLLPVSFLIAITGVLFRSEIMHMLYKHTGDEDAYVFAWLMMAFPAFSLSNVYSTLLTANGNLRILNRIALAGVIINLTLNFLLIPRYLSLGAAVTAYITQTALAVCFIVYSQRQAALPTSVKWILSFTGYLVLMAVIGYCCRMLPFPWLVQLGIFFLTGVAMMAVFRFITPASVKQLLNRSSR